MKKMLVISCLLAAGLIACGSKNKTGTTPSNTQKTETKSDGSATGGATYGAAKTPTKPAGGSTDDPCAAH
jgi:hypothetical protein